MSNPLAISAVTEVLRRMLDDAVKAENLNQVLPIPPKVTALPADRVDTDALAESRINLFLYQTSWNSGWRNVDLPSADSSGRRLANPPLAVDLHYLVTAYGVGELEAESLLGFAIQTLHEARALGRDAIRKALTSTPAKPSITALAASGLAEQVEQIKLTPHPLTTEDLSRLWSAIQSPMRPSLAYLATVVLIEKAERTRSALPVRSVGSYVAPFRQPVIDVVENDLGPRVPVTSGATLAVLGRQLAGESTVVHLGSQELTPTAVTDDRLKVVLGGGLRSGVLPVVVVRKALIGLPATPRDSAESNAAAVVLRPTITVSLTGPITPTTQNGRTSFAGKVRVVFDPKVGRDQRVKALLDPWKPPKPGDTTILNAPGGNGVTDPDTETDTIDFPFAGLDAGDFVVRARVDGAESLLAVESDPNKPTFGLYNGEPKVTLP